MFKRLLLFSCLAISFLTTKAAYFTVPVTGFTQDIVANGAGPASGSTSTLNLGNYDFMAADFVPATGVAAPTSFLPTGGLINSASTTGLSFQLQSYSSNNALYIAGVGTDSLVFVTPRTAGEVDVLNTSADNASTVTMIVNFTDGTNQTFAAQSVNDWYGGANYAILGLGRVNLPGSTAGSIDNNTTNPRLYENKLSLSSTNYSKLIRSITFQKTSTGSEYVVMGISVSTPCSGAPTAGATVSAVGATACPSANFALSLPTATGGIGIAYQWQSSATGSAPWVNITGATASTYTASQTTVTSYRAYVLCTASNLADTSTSVTITMAPAAQCYCSAGATTTADEEILNVTFGALNNSSTCTSAGPGPGSVQSRYSNFTTLNPVNVTVGLPTTFSIQVGTCGTSNYSNISAMWLDLNQDGIFDNVTERVYGSSTYTSGPHTESGTYTIPVTTPTGITRLRVMNIESTSLTSLTPCASFGYGEVEDYVVNLLPLLPCVAPNPATAVVLTVTSSNVNGAITAPIPAADQYLIVRTAGTAALNASPVGGTVYQIGSTLGNGTVVAVSTSPTFTDANLPGGTTYTYTVFAANNLCSGAPLYATTPATATTATLPQGVYSWNGAISTDWQIAGNWTPARSTLDPGDILQFNTAGPYTVTNIPTQTLRRITFSGNTNTTFAPAAAATLTLNSDNVPATNELDIASGSSLIAAGTAQLTVKFGGIGATAGIAGKLESVNTASISPSIDFSNSIATVTSTGELASGAAVNSGANNYVSSATTLFINGTYNHKFTTNSGGGIPTATYGVGSTVLISGFTGSTGGPNGGLGQTFYNFTYNCPNQTASANWSGPNPLNITGTLSVISTGTGTWQYAGNQAFVLNIGNYSQTGGTFDLSSGNTTSVQTMNIAGSFSKTGGILRGTNTTGNPTLNFMGTTTQVVSVNDAPTGRIVYRISNPAGINLVGTGSLTAFNINDNGGIRISTTAANPINTTLAITYSTTGSTLTYDTTGSYTMTASVFPVTAGPQNLVINIGISTNVITMPFSRTIPGTLTMTSGDIGLGANVLTLGSSATSAGILAYTAGNIRVTTGSMVRWFGTSGLPVAVGNIGLFPVSTGILSRAVNVYFSSATALSTGGTIGVGHTNGLGLVTGLSVNDAGYTINQRTNASWAFTAGNGIAASGTLGVRLLGSGLFTALNPSNLRVMMASSVAGVHAAGAGPAYASRTGLTITDLTAPYYIGAATADMGGAYIAINNGLWSVGTTWDVGTAPGVLNDAYINPGVTVTADAATNTAKSLNILTNGALTINTGIVTIDSALQNNGTVNVGGGTLVVSGNSGVSGITNNNIFNLASGIVTLGPTGGSLKPFTNNANATVSVTGGTLNINGNLNCVVTSIFNQSAGNINVDGNAGGVAANSVGSGTAIVSFKSQLLNLTGGNFTIVDPHANSTASNSLEYNNGTATLNVPKTHTFIFGDGVSTDAGGNATNGMRFNPALSSRMTLGNVTVNGGAGTNRYLTNSSAFGINGDLTVVNNAELRMGASVYVTGNLAVNSGGTLTTQAFSLYFASYLSGTAGFVTAAQTVTNNGTVRNSATAPTANAYNLYFYNTNGVAFNQDISFSNNLVFNGNSGVPSKAIMPGTNRMIEIAGAGGSNTVGATSGWVVGRYQKAVAIGGISNTYPVGDLNRYAPVVVTGTALTAGALWASTTSGDHPNLATSTINPGATANRYYTLDTLNGLTITPGSISATFNYTAPDLDPGIVPANLIIGEYKGTAWTYPTVASPTATSIKATGLDNNISGQFAVGEGCTAITIVTPPVNKTGCIGVPISFSVNVTPKAGVTYQWKKAGVNITGATDSLYTIPVVAATDAGSYTVTITSGCSSVTAVTSTAATLSINNPASITVQPAAATAFCEGSPGTLAVTAAGTGITYQWKKAGVAILGATASSYTIPVVALTDAGSYSVDIIGTAPCGTVTSNASVVTVKHLPLVITAASTTSFCVGSSVVLNASTTPSTLTYQWQNNGVNVVGTASAYTAGASGNYRALITDTDPANGCTSPSNVIIVNASGAPQAIISPAGTAAYCAGSSVTLHGNSVSGLTYQWLKNGNATPVGLDSTYIVNTPGTYVLKVFIGAGCSTTSTPTIVTENALPVITTVPVGSFNICQNDTLTITAVYNNATIAWKLNGNAITPAATGNIYKATASGNYSVTATNTATGCVNTSAPVTLTVNPLPTVTVTSTNAATFCAGGRDTLKAAPITGLTYVWNRGGVAINPAATDSNYIALVSGSYTVTATNANGCRIISTPIVVTSNPLPSVLITPSNGLTICQGQTTNLCIPAVTGVTYQWKNAAGNIAGATSACYAATTTGVYTVTATIAATGCLATSASSAVTVNPIPAAVIATPSVTTACAGDTVCLNAGSGAGLTYQWKYNGNNIVGATNAIYCTTTTGAYSVVVTNGSNCAVTSAVVNMTFNPRPTSTISYTTPVTFCEGGAVVLTGVSNTGTTYQWQNNGAAVTGATNSSYIASTTGSYSVIITNSFGCSKISATILVVSNPIPQPVITRTVNILSTGSYASYQWYLNSQPISGATGQSINATINGGYAVRVIDANGCTNYSSVIFLSNVGIGGNPAVAASAVKVFPNPVHNIINIQAPAQVNVLLRDLSGRMIKQVDNAKQLDMSGLPDGYYMLMISDKNGLMIKAEKVMKVAE